MTLTSPVASKAGAPTDESSFMRMPPHAGSMAAGKALENLACDSAVRQDKPP